MKKFFFILAFLVSALLLSAQSIDCATLEREFEADMEPLKERRREVTMNDSMPFVERTKAFRSLKAEYEQLLRKYAEKVSVTQDDKDKELLQEEIDGFLIENDGIKHFEMVGVMNVDVSHPSADSTIFGLVVAEERLINVRDKVIEMYNYLLPEKEEP